MARWHERNCREPEVIIAGGIPYCNSCFSLAPSESPATASERAIKTQSSNETRGRSRELASSWPPQVRFHHPVVSENGTPFLKDEEAEPLSTGSHSQAPLGLANTPDQVEHPAARSGTPPETKPNTQAGQSVDLTTAPAPPATSPAATTRLLKLQASADFASPLHGDLEVIQLGNLSEGTESAYEYLSCCDASLFPTEEREDHELNVLYVGRFWDPYLIDSSTDSALRRLRHLQTPSKATRTLWVRGLCDVDDQATPGDDPAQVALLGTILRGASRVIAYIGEPSEMSGAALKWLMRFDELCDTGLGACDASSSFSRKRKYDAAGGNHDSKGISDLRVISEAIKELFQRPYFQSIRTVPELIIPQAILVQCGSLAVPWPLSQFPPPRKDDGGSASATERMVQQHVPEWLSFRDRRAFISERDLLALLRSTSSLSCVDDPRDRIRSILSVVSRWSDGRGPVVDYHSLSLEEVCVGMAAYLIQHCDGLVDVLALAGTRRLSRSPTVGDAAEDVGSVILPSWVPHWDAMADQPARRADSAPLELCRTGQAYKTAKWLFQEEGASRRPVEIYISGCLQLPVTFLRCLNTAEQRPDGAWWNPSYEPDILFMSRLGRFDRGLFGAHRPELAGSETDNGQQQQNNLCDSQCGGKDHLVWLAGQFAIIRQQEDVPGKRYQLVEALGSEGVIRIPRQMVDPEVDEEDDEMWERLAESMFANNDNNTNMEQDSSCPCTTRPWRSPAYESRSRVFEMSSVLFNDSNDHLAAQASDAEGEGSRENFDGRFRRTMDRLLSVALCTRTGFSVRENLLGHAFARACSNFRDQDGLGAQFLSSPALDIVNAVSLGRSDTLSVMSLATISEKLRNWSLGKSLKECAMEWLPLFEPLLQVLVDWLEAVEGALEHIERSSKKGMDEMWLPGTPPGSSLPGRWLEVWQNQLDQLAADTARQTSDFMSCLQFATRLAKISISKLPDLGDTGLANLNGAITQRASIFERVADLQWVRDAFWARDVSHLSEFEQDMVVRLELYMVGLKPYHDQVIMLV